PLGGTQDPRDDLEQRRLPGPVRPDQSERGAFVDLDADVLQRPELLGPHAELREALLQRCGTLPVPAELLADLLDLDGGVAHSSSAKSPESLKNCRQNRYSNRSDPMATAPITIASNPTLTLGS